MLSARENTPSVVRKGGLVPCGLVETSRNGGISIRGNTDTTNPIGVFFVDQQGLAGLDVPHPEW